MAYRLIGIDGQEINQHDLQDKGVWCQTGASQEEVFVTKYGDRLNLIINPDKETNPYVPDLLNIKNNQLGDLKTQNTPFFQARSRFSYDPQYTVVFNGKDRERYSEMYPNIEIYFAVDWQAVKFVGSTTIEVEPMKGIWYIPFQKLDMLCNNSPFHSYQQRYSDNKGNAKGSYVLNLLDESFHRVV